MSAQEIVAVRLVAMDLVEYLRGQHTMVLTRPSRKKQPTRSLCSFGVPRAGSLNANFEQGLSKAEIVSFDDLDESDSVAEACTHGKDYVMQDGEVVEFRNNTTSGGKE